MTQPAKTQEPSMEEILASIRRIIADDEAKPAANDSAAPPVKPVAVKSEPAKPEPVKLDAPPRPQAMSGIPPSQLKVAQPPAKPAPSAGASNNQDDIDAMLADLDAGTAESDVRPARAEADVFELTEQMAIDAPIDDAESDVEFSDPDPAPQPQPPSFERAPQLAASYRPASASPPPQSSAANPVMSQATVFAVESAFNSLASTVLSNNARTLEDLVKEMLRPMLKSWLDDNLPNLVERLVRAEIERVSRGNPR